MLLPSTADGTGPGLIESLASPRAPIKVTDSLLKDTKANTEEKRREREERKRLAELEKEPVYKPLAVSMRAGKYETFN